MFLTPILAVFLYFIGFTSTGVTAGSAAAMWQSYLGNVVSGSLFSTMQCIAMTA